MHSGITRTLDLPVTQAQLDRYAAGTLLQDAFPDLSADAREFIKTGITGEEWNQLFPPEDEDGEEKPYDAHQMKIIRTRQK